MKHVTMRVPVQTSAREHIIDITREVNDAVRKSGIKDGICVVFSMHTTCGITINENADPDVKDDLIHHLARVYPASERYRHAEGNSDAHLKTSTVGPSVTAIVEGGKLVLGTWQGIMLCEFDGPRHRVVAVHVQGD